MDVFIIPKHGYKFQANICFNSYDHWFHELREWSYKYSCNNTEITHTCDILTHDFFTCVTKITKQPWLHWSSGHTSHYVAIILSIAESFTLFEVVHIVLNYICNCVIELIDSYSPHVPDIETRAETMAS